MSEFILGWEKARESGYGFTANEVLAQSGTLITDDSDGHILTIAGTGGGKGRSVAIPNLLHWDGPAIVLDIKGELTATTALYRRDVFGQEIVVLDPWGITDFEPGSLNPLSGLVTGKRLADDSCVLASQFSSGAPQHLEIFWTERAEAVIAGLLAHIVTDPNDTSVRLDRLYALLHGDDAIYNAALLLDSQKDTMPVFAYQQIASLLQTAAVTREGIVSSAQSLVRVLGGDLIQQATASTSFNLQKVTEGAPLTIYIVVPPVNLRSHAAIIRLWLSCLLSLITSRKAAPAKPTLLLLDEIAQLGPMEQVQSAITLTRSYGVRVALFFQSYSQLVSLYPRDHSVILENCGTLVTMGHSMRTMAAAMATALGDVTTDALASMARDEAAVKSAYQGTRIVRRLDYLTDPLFAGRFAANPLFANRPAATRILSERSGNGPGRER